MSRASPKMRKLRWIRQYWYWSNAHLCIKPNPWNPGMTWNNGFTHPTDQRLSLSVNPSQLSIHRVIPLQYSVPDHTSSARVRLLPTVSSSLIRRGGQPCPVRVPAFLCRVGILPKATTVPSTSDTEQLGPSATGPTDWLRLCSLSPPTCRCGQDSGKWWWIKTFPWETGLTEWN